MFLWNNIFIIQFLLFSLLNIGNKRFWFLSDTILPLHVHFSLFFNNIFNALYCFEIHCMLKFDVALLLIQIRESDKLINLLNHWMLQLGSFPDNLLSYFVFAQLQFWDMFSNLHWRFQNFYFEFPLQVDQWLFFLFFDPLGRNYCFLIPLRNLFRHNLILLGLFRL